MIVREARCACGALKARVEGDPVRLSICHCLDCKRRTGSAFGWNATYAAAQVAVEGPYQSFTRGSDDGYWVRHHFCPACGVTIWYEIERRPNMVSIPAGAFADHDRVQFPPGKPQSCRGHDVPDHFPPPAIEVYAERRCPWLPDIGIPTEF